MVPALLAVLLTACGSSSDLIDSETIACAEMGNEVTVLLSGVNVETSPSQSMSVVDPQVTIDVEVSNNTNREIVVKSIVLRPRNQSGARFELNNAYGKFNETIAEGEEHVFTLRTTGRWRRSITDVIDPSAGVEVETRVELENGQTYRCQFAVPVG